MIETLPPKVRLADDFDARVISLSFGSRRIFESLDIWPALNPVALPIQSIHISDRGHFGATRFDASKEGFPALGYVIEAQTIHQVLTEALQNDALSWYCPATVIQMTQDTDNMRTSYKLLATFWITYRIKISLAIFGFSIGQAMKFIW